MAENKNADIWDLTPLFKSNEAASEFLAKLLKKAKVFEKKYSGNLGSVSDFDAVLGEFEGICEGIGRVMTYAFLLFAKDTTNGAFYAQCELKANEVESKILFFELEWTQLDSKKINKHIKNSTRYAYYLQKLKEAKKYQLSKAEEKLLLKLSPISANAFSRLFDEFMSGMKFNFENAKISEEEILSKLHNPSRSVRKAAQKELTRKLKKSQETLRYIINIIRKDVAISRELRGYESVESFRHIDNQISQKSVDSMISVVVGNFALVERYYRLKAKILGIKELKDYDRYAPIFSQSQEFDYNEAKKIVLETYSDFSPLFGKIAKEAFDKKWVDSHPEKNKRGGAFSHGAVPSAHPYVLLNYTNNRRDVFTIAHEFGHALHQELSKSVGYLNMDTPLTTAETASVFGEMLLFDKMKQNLSGKELLSLYAGKIEDIFSTLFRQVVMTNFERKIHNAEGELNVAKLNKIWQDENAKMFGKSLKLTKNYALWWSYIPHFIHSPFYCYAYSYGQLLSLTLFGLYKSGTKDFVENYTKFLSLGGSKSPKDLVNIFGYDIEDEKFWNYGMGEVEQILKDFEKLLKEQGY